MLNTDDYLDSVDDVFEFDDEEGNQTDTLEDSENVETAEETEEDSGKEDAEEAQEEPENDETAEEVMEDEAEKVDAEGNNEGNNGDPEQKFTIKVNKQDIELTAAQMVEYAQKGADYDRVKGQLETSRQNEQTLQAEVDKSKPVMEILKLAAEQGGMSVDQLLENVQIGLLKGKGMSEAEAKAEIRAAKAEKQLKTMTEQQTQRKAAEDSQNKRAQREIAEFRKNFPDVQLTEELCGKLASDVQAGMSLTNAYLKMENSRLAAELEAQKQQQAATAQNKKNRAKTPGSMRDSGGGRTKDLADIFEDVLFS